MFLYIIYLILLLLLRILSYELFLPIYYSIELLLLLLAFCFTIHYPSYILYSIIIYNFIALSNVVLHFISIYILIDLFCTYADQHALVISSKNKKKNHKITKHFRKNVRRKKNYKINFSEMILIISKKMEL